MLDLLGTPRADLVPALQALGIPEGQAPRVFGGLHRQRRALEDIADLGRHARVLGAASWRATARVVAVQPADDGTDKLLLELHDGARIEAVLVPMMHGRRTLCVSTQVGCAMGCTFCATGTLGLSRNLRAGEIVAQVHAALAHAEASGSRVTRLVFMGMGEPLHNADALADALRVLLDGHGVGFGSRNVVVSTVGLPERLRRFGADFEGRVCLALSLHAGTDATRRRIVPAARATSLAELKALLQSLPFPGSRKLMLEVVVLPGVNDGPDELDGMAAFADGLPAVINLIPFNPFPGSDFRTPTPDELTAMYAGLKARGAVVTVRKPRGREAAGACGQLALREIQAAEG
ncbi:MAG: 23S rRNA (adenine(2503)-C(2))-methyltransferase RlmN [Alphaproteobacteria bacterium]|nr:23S rRNA (adenine(2503)-C(2))-methyltransferase RlmN [Alphaproteobacteria bacterium]